MLFFPKKRGETDLEGYERTQSNSSIAQAISGVAFAVVSAIFTVVAGYFQWSHLRQEERLANRAELSRLLQDAYSNEVVADAFVNLSSLLADAAEPTDPEAAARYRLGAALGYGRYVQGNDVLLSQAQARIDDLPSGHVLITDYLAMAHGYYNSGNLQKACVAIKEGLTRIDRDPKQNYVNEGIQLNLLMAVIEQTRNRDDDATKYLVKATDLASSVDGERLDERGPIQSIVFATRAALEHLNDSKPGDPAQGCVVERIAEAKKKVRDIPHLDARRMVDLIAKGLRVPDETDEEARTAAEEWEIVNQIVRGESIRPSSRLNDTGDIKEWLKAVASAKATVAETGWTIDDLVYDKDVERPLEELGTYSDRDDKQMVDPPSTDRGSDESGSKPAQPADAEEAEPLSPAPVSGTSEQAAPY